MNAGNISTGMLLAVTLIVGGCRELSMEYGSSRGYAGRTSLNGFGALRRAYENAGFESRDATRLSDRVSRTDTIVWTPQIHGPIDRETMQWFDRWLASGGKTLVYVLPDSGSEADYWQTAARLAPPKQRLEYRRRLARSINRRMRWRINRQNIRGSGWFDLESTLSQIESEPADSQVSELANASATEDRTTSDELSTELSIAPIDIESIENPTSIDWLGLQETGPTSPTYAFPTDTECSQADIEIESMLENQAEFPVVAKLVAQDWPDSRIIVVAGGSLLTNYAFTRDFNRKLAAQIINESPYDDGDQVAFVTTPWSLVPVSNNTPGVPQTTGMELLTVWPISLITLHGIMIVLVIGLTLVPIFGRPKRVVASSQRDFGDHLDAVAALMNKAGGEEFARQRIDEYRKRIHGEHATIAESTSNTPDEEAR